jgi:hypothetical protein
MLCRVQAYGTPPAQLSSYRFADLPEGEQGDEAGHWNHFTPTRWASSAGHLYGAPVISAEAWTWIHALPFRATPLDFKASADEYFLEGINQLVYRFVKRCSHRSAFLVCSVAWQENRGVQSWC